jgi:hypothetical protein
MAGIMPLGNKERGEPGDRLVKVVGEILEELVSSSQKQNQGVVKPMAVTKFHGLRAPSIAVTDYLKRISKFSGCSDECFVLALIYIDRLITRRKIVLDSLNVHRLLVTAVMLSAKFFDDHYLDNQHYASVGGVSKVEMNTLELEFLFLLEFNLHVTTQDYEAYHNALLSKFNEQIQISNNNNLISGHPTGMNSVNVGAAATTGIRQYHDESMMVTPTGTEDIVMEQDNNMAWQVASR